MKIEPIENGKFYHIYNRGINGCNIFNKRENYSHFLRLYNKYIEPVTETYSWCLMPNHFHLLVYIKEAKEIIPQTLTYRTTKKPKQVNASKQFGHLFNAYSQAFNKQNGRTGSLFEKPFERKWVDSEKYLKTLIFYIHNNPVHHGFTNKITEYEWTSYASFISTKPTKLKREKVIAYFDTVDNFVCFHSKKQNLHHIKHLLIDY